MTISKTIKLVAAWVLLPVGLFLLVGLLGGPVGVVIGAAVGAFYGGIAGATVDGGMPDEDLTQIGALLDPGGQAVVVFAAEPGATWTEKQLESEGGTLLEIAHDSAGQD